MLITCYLFTVAVYIHLMDHRTLRINRLNLLGCNILTLSKKIPNQVSEPWSAVKIAVDQFSKTKIATGLLSCPIFKQYSIFFRVYIPSPKHEGVGRIRDSYANLHQDAVEGLQCRLIHLVSVGVQTASRTLLLLRHKEDCSKKWRHYS